MLYFLFGENTEIVRIKFNELQKAFLKKTGGFPVSRIDDDNFSENIALDILKSESLFSSPNFVVGRNLLAGEQSGKFFLENISLVSGSSAIFLLWEEKASPNLLKIAQKHAQKFWEVGIKGKKVTSSNGKKKNPALFLIADALALKQKEKAWFLFQKQMMSGVPAEDIFWIISWQFKTLLLVSKEEKIEIHDFAFKKAEKAIKFFKPGELENHSAGLLNAYHKSKSGGNLAVELEKFILRV